MPAATRRQRSPPDIWPGFVDAISAILIIVIFLLMVFTIAQYFLGEILSGRDEAIERLNREVRGLAQMLALEEQTNAELREGISGLAAQLKDTQSERKRLSSRLTATLSEQELLKALLTERTTERDSLSETAADTEKQAADLSAELEDAYKTISADKQRIEIQLRRLESLERDIQALRALRDRLEKEVAEQAARITGQTEEAGALRDRSKELTAELASERERTLLSQKTIEDQDVRLAALLGRSERAEEALSAEQDRSRSADRQMQRLNDEIAGLRAQLGRISLALQASEEKAKTQKVEIANLAQRLNSALLDRVQELESFRSEFFGQLRKALGNRRDIRVVGDRFVFASEVLFQPGDSQLQTEGRRQIARLARTLLDLSTTIPGDLDWVLRVDGHTDRTPISTSAYPSNWELSTARAVEVIKYLIELGVPPDRLAAAGFGEFHPIDSGDTPRAHARNRRIELKLTQR